MVISKDAFDFFLLRVYWKNARYRKKIPPSLKVLRPYLNSLFFINIWFKYAFGSYKFEFCEFCFCKFLYSFLIFGINFKSQSIKVIDQKTIEKPLQI